MFVKAVIRNNGIPFSIEGEKRNDVRARAVEAIRKMREDAAKRSEITLEEINAEIKAVRESKKSVAV